MAERRTGGGYGGVQGAGGQAAAEGGRGLSEVATELGLSTGQLSTWRTEIWRRVRPRRWLPERPKRRRCCGSNAR